jgi:hypothetical protein
MTQQDSVTTTLPCNAPLAFSVVINGIDYPLDSQQILRPGGGPNDTCIMPILETSGPVPLSQRNSVPSITLGNAMLRSLYFAYRFPTDDCPGFIGLARPSRRPHLPQQTSTAPTTQIDQTLRSKCLAFVQPGSPVSNASLTATAPPSGLANAKIDMETYTVFGGSGGQQMLLNAKELEWQKPRSSVSDNGNSDKTFFGLVG